MTVCGAGPGPALVLVPGRDPLAAEIGWIGGHDVYARAHARAARQAAFAPHLFCGAGQAGVQLTSLGCLHRVRRRPWPYKIWMAPVHVGALARAVEGFVAAGGHAPVVIHGFGVWGAVATHAARRLRTRGHPAVAVVSAYATHRFEARARVAALAPSHGLAERLQYRALHQVARHVVDRMERRACRDAEVVLVNYDAVARQLVEAYGPGVRWRKIPYSSESAFRAGEPRADLVRPGRLEALQPAGAPLVLAVSRHDPRKGLEVLFRALARLRDRGVPFRGCLVGGGPLLERSRRQADRLGLRGQVTIEGLVPDPGPYLARADVFVVPSIGEGSGSLALVEALEAGLPVVASACDGIPEDVEEGRSALLVPPGDPEALASALARLLGDPGLRATLRRGALAAHARRFSRPAFVAALAEVYADLGLTRPANSGPAGDPANSLGDLVAPPREVC